MRIQHFASVACLLFLHSADARSAHRFPKRSTPENSRITFSYDDSLKPLICDGKTIPGEVRVVGPFPDQDLGSDWNFNLSAVVFQQSPSPTSSGFDVRRRFEIQSNDIASTVGKKLPESHGCDIEYYAQGATATTGPNGSVNLNIREFMAARVCWNPPSASRRAICSREGSSTYLVGLKFLAPTTFAQCIDGQRSPNLFEIKSNGMVTPPDMADAECFGMKAPFVGVASIVTGQIGGLIPALLTNLLEPKGGSGPFKDVDVSRLKGDILTFCPDEHEPIATKMLSPDVLEVDVKELYLNMPQGLTCAVFKKYGRTLSLLAERANPTKTVIAQQDESLWNVAERLWADGRLYPFLIRANHLRKGIVKGQTLNVPALEVELLNPRVIREGDSLWVLKQRLQLNRASNDAVIHMIDVPKAESEEKIYPFGQVTKRGATK